MGSRTDIIIEHKTGLRFQQGAEGWSDASISSPRRCFLWIPQDGILRRLKDVYHEHGVINWEGMSGGDGGTNGFEDGGSEFLS